MCHYHLATLIFMTKIWIGSFHKHHCSIWLVNHSLLWECPWLWVCSCISSPGAPTLSWHLSYRPLGSSLIWQQPSFSLILLVNYILSTLHSPPPAMFFKASATISMKAGSKHYFFLMVINDQLHTQAVMYTHTNTHSLYRNHSNTNIFISDF